MTIRSKIASKIWWLPFLALAALIAQPLLGWRAIPEFFDNSMGWAVVIGIGDGVMFSASVLIAVFVTIKTAQ